MKKSELRAAYLSKQKELSPHDRAERSQAISDLFFATVELSGKKYLHSFLPIKKFNEVDTRLIIEKLRRDFPHIGIVVPRVDFESGEMRSLEFKTDTELRRNAWDIDEPVHDEFVETGKIDIILVPGLCFDRAGHRVGYGKGFYDRFLKMLRADCKKIGLSYFDPVKKIDDVHEGDVRLDIVISPGGVTPDASIQVQ